MKKITLLFCCLAVSLTFLICWLPRTSGKAIRRQGGVGLADLMIEDVSPRSDNFPVSANLQQSSSGRMLSLAVSSDGERLYVGGFSGVWRSDDGGTTWRQLTRPQPAPGADAVAGALFGATVYDLVVSPVNKDLVLAATFRDGRAVSRIGVYRSTNGGDSWSLAHQFTCGGTGGGRVGQIVFAPDNPNLLYAAGGCAVAISHNGGMTWENKTLPGGGSVWHVAVAPQQGSVRRVYATGDNRFWYSEDGGETWFIDMSSGLPLSFGFFPSDFAESTGAQILAIEPGRPERVYMAVAGFANGPSYYHPSNLGPDGNHCNTPIVHDNNLNGAYDAGEALLVAVNATGTITIVAQVNCSTPDGAVIINTASISSPTTDPNPDNNSATAMNKAFNPPPTIACPADLTVVTALPGDMSVVVNYPPPVVTDNCPGATVACLPPSGASFPLGMTTVNCTVTDSGGATASCSFKVTVWDVCIQDDRRGDVLLFNSFTGDYSFTKCGPDGFTMTGIGRITRVGCITRLEDDTRIVSAEIDRCLIAPKNRGSASIKRTNPGTTFILNDSNILNHTGACPP